MATRRRGKGKKAKASDRKDVSTFEQTAVVGRKTGKSRREEVNIDHGDDNYDDDEDENVDVGDVGERLTLDALDAISSEEDSDDGGDDNGDDEGGREGGYLLVDDDDDDEEEGRAEAEALRRAIAEGAFDGLAFGKAEKEAKGGAPKKENKRKGGKDDYAVSKEEDEAVDDDDDSEDDSSNNSEDEDQDQDQEAAKDEAQDQVTQVALEDDSSDSDDDDNLERDGRSETASGAAAGAGVGTKAVGSARALRVVADALGERHVRMAWAETFDVVPTTPLPFAPPPDDGGGGVGDGAGDMEVVDVHDDLKREVAFYNSALEAVHIARAKCLEIGVPFSRPDDFFAEMVKTDDHMAKVKDWLIFETKKMEAFEQRKANKEIKARAKEARAHRAAEKAKAKKDHLKAVDDWAKSAASDRLGGGRVRDGGDDDYLEKLGGGGGGPNKKRMAADRKYGRGGKKSRFKYTDNKSLKDMSEFNPRGPASLRKGQPKSGGGGGGKKRMGKRARDSARSRRKS